MQRNGVPANSALAINRFTASRNRAAQPNAGALAKRAAAIRKQQVSASLVLIDKVLRNIGVAPATIQKAKGAKLSAPPGLGELLKARMLRNRLQREGKL